MVSRTLYDLTVEYDRVFEAAIEHGDEGELTPDFVRLIAELEGAIESKLENCCRVLKNMQGLQDMLEAEYKRMWDRAKSIEGNATRLKDYVQSCMELAGIDKTNAGPFRLSIVKNSQPSVEILDMALIPHTYDKPAERQVSLSQIRDAVKAGREVPGVSVVRGTHLRVG